MKFIDITGHKYGRLKVLKLNGLNERKRKIWLCQCDCGQYTTLSTNELRTGNTQSCGCLHKEILIKNNKKRAYHSLSRTKLYGVYNKMKARCNHKNHRGYEYYGGKNIKVCEEWSNDFRSFREWALNNGYQEGLTIDRKNLSGNYTPENCRWVTWDKQSINKTNTRFFEYKGKKQTLREWSMELNFNYKVLCNRIHRHKWTFERAITQVYMPKILVGA